MKFEKVADFNKKIHRVHSVEDLPFTQPMKRIYLYTKVEIQEALKENCDVLCETIEHKDRIISRCYIEVDMNSIIKCARKR